MLEVIRIEYTPNPNALKFILDHFLTKKGESFYYLSEADAPGKVFVLALFAIEHAESVYLQDNFLTINKSEEGSWESIAGSVKEVVEMYDDFGYGSIYESQAEGEDSSPIQAVKFDGNFAELSQDEKIGLINGVMDSDIRDGLAADGGGLEILGINSQNVVSIAYFGACGGCPSSTTGTLMYIEQLLQERFDNSITVIPVS